MIIINTEQGIRDLFEKRSGNYAAKAPNFGAEFGENLNLLFRRYMLQSLILGLVLRLIDEHSNDDTWRRMRKMYHVRLNITAANKYIPYQVRVLHTILLVLFQVLTSFSRSSRAYRCWTNS